MKPSFMTEIKGLKTLHTKTKVCKWDKERERERGRGGGGGGRGGRETN